MSLLPLVGTEFDPLAVVSRNTLCVRPGVIVFGRGSYGSIEGRAPESFFRVFCLWIPYNLYRLAICVDSAARAFEV